MVWGVVVSSVGFGWWVVFVSPNEIVVRLMGGLSEPLKDMGLIWVVVVSTGVLVVDADGYLVVGLGECGICYFFSPSPSMVAGWEGLVES